MLLSAGVGSRLKPLTDLCPKALVEVGGMTLLERAVRLLKRHSVEEIILNVHHFGDLIDRFLKEKADFGIKIAVSDERDLLLDTGGGLKKASWFFQNDGPFLVYNVDILTDLDLGALYRAHLQSDCLATLAVRRRPANRRLLFGEDLALLGWRNHKTGETRWCGPEDRLAGEFAFSGIQVFDPAIFEYFPEARVFSLVELYLRAGTTGRVFGYLHDDSLWMDAGKIEDLAQAEEMVRKLGS